MCLAPITLNDEYRTKVACRSCSMCRDNRLNDLVGRCVAEQSTASATFAVTLTYSGDGPEAAILRYSDVQKFLKRLRKDGYTVRYICAGEYGAVKGRAHWHIVLFFYGKVPQIEMERRVDWKFWPHGFSYFQQPEYKGFRYVMKYALKSDIEGSIKALSMSKKPPLGHSFFMELASDMVKRSLPLHDPSYSFAHVLDRKGVPRRYWLRGRMAEMFCERYVQLWQNKFNRLPPYTDWLYEQYLDKIARKELDLDPVRFERDKAARQAEYLRRSQARRKADFKAALENQRQDLGFLMLEPGSRDMLIAYSDYTAELFIGESKWLLTEERKDVDVTVQKQLLRTSLMRSKYRPALLFLEREWNRYRSQVASGNN